MDFLSYSRHIRETATQLLEQSRLLTLLQQYCIPELNGSYRFDLMYGPDIDIDVFTLDPKTISRRVLEKLLDQGYFQRYEYGDFDQFSVPTRPRGYILVLGSRIQDVYWEIEIWFLYQRSSEDVALPALMQQKMTPQTRDLILQLKHERHRYGKAKHTVSSVDIYRGVLEHNLSTLEAIEHCLPMIRSTPT